MAVFAPWLLSLLLLFCAQHFQIISFCPVYPESRGWQKMWAQGFVTSPTRAPCFQRSAKGAGEGVLLSVILAAVPRSCAGFTANLEGSRTRLMVGVPAVSGKLTQHGRRIGAVCFWVVLHCFAHRFLHLLFSWLHFPLNLFLCGSKCRQLKRQLRQEKQKGEL